ncbi:BlaI/MecI/CopY family transcriptional regulator [Verrucomicrobium spinosum]|uniref:BlaI/MecI/CopY family transcriptional regulator n=1 Tax=Verrucomicrobium spinosum TaxID=2736 RepID=UPI00017444A1|nr:BlaI/MecI/CopY family transcriptional regulator [Verrucomicrobium spinosum]
MKRKLHELSRRERQIMELILVKGSASAAEVEAGIPDAPSYSAIRALLRILEEKGHLKHREEGGRYVYEPVEAPQTASRSALQQVVKTFFGGSLADAVAAFVDDKDGSLSSNELKRLEDIIKKAGKPDAGPRAS